MSLPFRHTLRALERRRLRGRTTALQAVLAALLGLAWVAWFTAAQVAVHATSERARIEVVSDAHPVQAILAGTVLSSDLQVGDEVEVGDPLVRLDPTVVELDLREERARRLGYEAQLGRVVEEVALAERSLAEAARAADAAALEGAARARARDADAGRAEQDAQRAEQLFAQGAAPEAERDRLATLAAGTRASAEAQSVASVRRRWELAAEATDRRAHAEALRRRAAELRASIETSTVAIAKLERRLADHVLRAPVAGRLAGVEAPGVGERLTPGRVVAQVVPDRGLRVVADFRPAQALGRVRPGLPARLRLDGFPWSQYGSVGATVAATSSEPQRGLVRVELTVEPDPHRRVPVEHGLPGIVEVELETATPATLVLRAAGRLLARPAAPAPPRGPEPAPALAERSVAR